MLRQVSPIGEGPIVPSSSVCPASKWTLEPYPMAFPGEVACTGVDLVMIEPVVSATGPSCRAQGPSVRVIG